MGHLFRKHVSWDRLTRSACKESWEEQTIRMRSPDLMLRKPLTEAKEKLMLCLVFLSKWGEWSTLLFTGSNCSSWNGRSPLVPLYRLLMSTGDYFATANGLTRDRVSVTFGESARLLRIQVDGCRSLAPNLGREVNKHGMLLAFLQKNAEWQTCLEARSFWGDTTDISRSSQAKFAIQPLIRLCRSSQPGQEAQCLTKSAREVGGR